LLGSYPEINLFDNMFEISAVDTDARVEKDENVLENSIDRQLKIISDFIGHANNAAQKYNDGFRKRIKSLIEKRIQVISKFRKLSEKLNVPINATDPEVLKVVKVERKIFPLAKGKNSDREYSLAENSYLDILRIIKHHCSTFERTPSVYSIHKEEELRDIILAALNCLFEGTATGETFRKGGKADITIEVENRSAFVAECKIWDGIKVFEEAIDQLFKYITWRDSKLCLVIFSKRKDFFDVIDKIYEFLQKSPSKIALRSIDKNEFEYQCVSPKNTGQVMKIRIFVVDLHSV
jgi:DNA-binding transcriptional regulator GbsR (MarR family)